MQGYLRCNIVVLGPGDVPANHEDDEDDEDVCIIVVLLRENLIIFSLLRLLEMIYKRWFYFHLKLKELVMN